MGSPLIALALTPPSEPARISLMMLLIFGSAKLLAEIFERLNQPGIVGEILAGVLIGPSVLGWIAPNEFLTALANLGVIFLLFRVGLEVKSSELIRLGGVATMVASIGVVVPFLMGWVLLLAWGAPHVEAIFVGAAMVATSVGITAQVLATKGLLSERASKIILAAAVIDDVQGLLVLAVVSGLAKGRLDFYSLGTTAFLAIGFTVVVAKWGAQTMAAFVPFAHRKLRVAESQFVLAMLLLFLLSLAAVFVGVAAIVGAFLAGLALAEGVETRVRHLAHGVTELLVPFFLVGIGLQVNLKVFTHTPTLLLSLLLLLTAVISKFVGCGLGALRLGRADAIRVGVGMIPRGEVGMVVAQLGLAMGVVSRDIYSVVVFMAVATTVVAPPLIKVAFPSPPRAEVIDEQLLEFETTLSEEI